MDDQTEKTAPLSDMLGAVLSNPELLRRVGEVMGSVTPPRTEPPPDRTSPPQAGLEGVLQDPEFLKKLPQMMEMLRPMMAQGGQKAPDKAEALPDPIKQRNALLCALKPFLSPSRAAAVDTIIRLSYLGNLQGLLQGEVRS